MKSYIIKELSSTSVTLIFKSLMGFSAITNSIIQWTNDTIPETHRDNLTFYFKNEKHKIIFLLKWS